MVFGCVSFSVWVGSSFRLMMVVRFSSRVVSSCCGWRGWGGMVVIFFGVMVFGRCSLVIVVVGYLLV